MSSPRALVGRDAEIARLGEALDRAVRGAGSLVLLSGEAGVGKTRLAEHLAEHADTAVLRGAASQWGAKPHGPLVGALRSYLRSVPDGLNYCGPLRSHLALLLPELGEPAASTDRATLFEAFRCAFAAIASSGPALVVLDDLHWSDEATLDVLAALAEPLREMPVLAVGAYRSDEIARDHPMRRFRAELRRGGNLGELALEPLDEAATATLAEQVLGGPLAPRVARVIHDRTQGLPFFAEELASALHAGGLVHRGPRGFELEEHGPLPVPETVRDAVLMRTAGLSPAAREAAEAAAVAGESFDLDAVAELAGEEGLLELIENGIVRETGAGRAAFRHALARDAVYEDAAWLRRRALHRRLAERLELRGAANIELAEHWLGAREEARARAALVGALDDFCAVHAYRDAARAGRRALDLWPEGADAEERVTTLERYGRCAELAGDLTEAVRALREAEDGRRADGSGRALADSQRNLARVYELQGEREQAIAARRLAADGYAASGHPAEAAAERLAAAGHLQSSAQLRAAVELARAAGEEAQRAGRIDLRARALGLEGVAMAKRGEFEAGLETVRAGLSLALEHDLTADAADVYQRLGTVLESAGDYGGARDALQSAIGLCETTGAEGQEQGCVACMAYVLRELGEWDRSGELCDELLQDPDLGPGTRVITDGILGSIHGFRGDARAARPLLTSSLGIARQLDILSMAVDSAAGLAWIDELDGERDSAAAHCRFVLSRWERSEDHHYAVWGLRLASSVFAGQGDGDGARACADALARIATDTGHHDALAALAHALGESALLDGDADTAAEQLSRAYELHRTLAIPFERAHIALRAGAALLAAGERELAIERFGDAYRIARKLGARPLAARAAAQVAELGESLEQRLGRRAAADHEGAGLTRRELEVMRLVAVGRTNREIARDLFLSPRTVDMHVRNILGKLNCRSRVEATSRAHALGLVE